MFNYFFEQLQVKHRPQEMYRAMYQTLLDVGVGKTRSEEFVAFVEETGLDNIYSVENLIQIMEKNEKKGPPEKITAEHPTTKLVFHGTDPASAISIRDYGVNLNRTSPGGDFNDNCGFYVTPDLFYAARASQKYAFPHANQPLCVVVFRLDLDAPISFLGSDLWTETVKYNRTGARREEEGEWGHQILAGLNCKNPTETDAEDEPIPGRYHQLCFLTEASLKHLHFSAIIPYANELENFPGSYGLNG